MESYSYTHTLLPSPARFLFVRVLTDAMSIFVVVLYITFSALVYCSLCYGDPL